MTAHNASSFNAASNHIARVFGMLPSDMRISAEDPHGGYHADYEDGFPSGSLWRVEGQILYALVRVLKPANVLELGTWHGASATHLLQGLYDNGDGLLDAVDNRAYGDIVIGDMIPDALRPRMTPHASDLMTFIEASPDDRYGLIFEDAMHTSEQVAHVWSHAVRLLRPGGMIVSHDACHPIAGPVVRDGIAQAGYGDKALYMLIEPSDCGLALWRKPL